MTPPIVMDWGALTDAAGLYDTARGNADNAIRTLTQSLDANWGCAGTDNAGKTWASSYDPAAFDAVAGGTALVNAFAKLHDLLGYTAVNHANTEKSNKQPPEPPDSDPAQSPTSTAPTFKGSYGGDTDAPFGWGAISRWLQGHAWPNGDPDKLRSLGTAWRTAAKGLRDASSGTNSAWVKLEEVASGEIPQALAQMDLVFTAVEDVATQYESLGTACDDWARQIEDAHRQILRILGGALAAGLVVGILVGIFSAGIATPVVEAGIGGAAAAEIVTILVAFDAAAAVSAGVSGAVGVAIGGTVTLVQPLLEAVPTTFAASTGGGGNNWHYNPPPERLEAFPDAQRAKIMGRRRRWKDNDGNIYEWDSQHGAVEKYSKKGKHLGEYDPITGQQTGPVKPERKPEGS
jgi:hypothetical protein